MLDWLYNPAYSEKITVFGHDWYVRTTAACFTWAAFSITAVEILSNRSVDGNSAERVMIDLSSNSLAFCSFIFCTITRLIETRANGMMWANSTIVDWSTVLNSILLVLLGARFFQGHLVTTPRMYLYGYPIDTVAQYVFYHFIPILTLFNVINSVNYAIYFSFLMKDGKKTQ